MLSRGLGLTFVEIKWDLYDGITVGLVSGHLAGATFFGTPNVI